MSSSDPFCGVFQPVVDGVGGDNEDAETAHQGSTGSTDDEDFVEKMAFQDKEMTDEEAEMCRTGNCEFKDGYMICGPYKREVLKQQIQNNSPGSGRRSAIVETLRGMGVKVFIIDGKSVTSTKDMIDHVQRVIGYVSKENRVLQKTQPLGFQRCLLYQDRPGRLFNLMLDSRSVGPVGLWKDYMDGFSGLEALIALSVLSRSFSCAVSGAKLDSLRPAYLTLVLGLVLTEEIGLSGLNANMLIRGCPSISAHTLTSRVGSDLPKKLVLLILAASGAATGNTQRYATLVGIGLACILLLSNLGSRAWHFMGWKPLLYQGFGGSFLAYLLSIVMGIAFPYMGHRKIELGGSPAMNYVIRTAFLVAVAFVVSDIDVIQEFLVVGSEVCNQDIVNMVVGGWWFFALVSSLFMLRTLPKRVDNLEYDTEPLLIEDHESPVGYRVPSVPDFIVNPSLAQQSDGCISVKVEFYLGLIMAFVVGGGIIYLGFTDWDEEAIEYVENAVSDL